MTAESLEQDAQDVAMGRRFTVLRHRIGEQFRRANLSDAVSERVANTVAAGPVHWDWLFTPIDSSGDPGGMLWTWATDPLPEAVFGNAPSGEDVEVASLRAAAIRLPDHRPVYLDYQGELTKQRGTVEQVVTGTYRVDGPIGEIQTRFDVRLFFRPSGSIGRSVRVRLRRDQCADASGPCSSSWTLRLESVTDDAGSSAADAIE